MQILGSVLGVGAVALFLLSFQLKHRRGIIWCNAVSRALYVAQYLCLGAFEGAVLDLVGLLVSWVAERKDRGLVKRFLPWAMLLCTVLTLGVSAALYRSPVSLLATGGILFETLAFWLTGENPIRVVSLLGQPCWFGYNWLSGAYPSVVGNVLATTSIVTALIRYRSKGTKKEITPQDGEKNKREDKNNAG